MANVGAVTRLDWPDDGRALAVTDWDHDGRLDVFHSARTEPRLRLLHNRSDTDAHFLSVRLIGEECNRDAIGARLKLHFGDNSGRTLIRSLRAGEGFLGQSTKWVHFGLGAETQIDRLEIRWPDNHVQTVTGLNADQSYTVRQAKTAQSMPAVFEAALDNAGFARNAGEDRDRNSSGTTPDSESIRIVLSAPLTLPELDYRDTEDEAEATTRAISPKAGAYTLVNVWASWCLPCIAELEAFSRHADDLRAANVQVLALNVDSVEPQANGAAQPNAVSKIQQSMLMQHGAATASTLRVLDVVQRGLLDQQRPLALPTSFLLDDRQRLTIIYKGPVTAADVLSDVEELRRAPTSLARMSVPFAGRWYNAVRGPDPMRIAMRMIEVGDAATASLYLQKINTSLLARPDTQKSVISTNLFLARLLAEQHANTQAIATYQQILKMRPDHVTALVGLGHVLLQEHQANDAETHLRRVLQIDPRQTDAMAYMALARLDQGDAAGAAEWYRKALKVRPGWLQVANNLAWLLATDDDPTVRNGKEAVRLAKQFCDATNGRIPGMLDTLAAAYAETKDYASALNTIDRAVQLADEAGNGDLAKKLRSRRRRYAAGQAYREPKSETSTGP